jgi:hypothetical protein
VAAARWDRIACARFRPHASKESIAEASQEGTLAATWSPTVTPQEIVGLGLGQLTYDELSNRDNLLVVGCVVSSSVLLVVGNLA